MNGETRRVLVGVQGMEGEDARRRVDTALREVVGVQEVEVRPEGQAEILYDGSEATVMDFIRALRRIGFLAGME